MRNFFIKAAACFLVVAMLSACNSGTVSSGDNDSSTELVSSESGVSSEIGGSGDENVSSDITSSDEENVSSDSTLPDENVSSESGNVGNKPNDGSYDLADKDEVKQDRPWQNYTPSEKPSEPSDGDNTGSDDKSDEEKVVVPYNKAQLLELMEYLTFDTDNYAVGLHAAGSTSVNTLIRKFQKKVGQKPAVFDFDMTNLAFNVSDRAMKSAVNQLTAFAAEGGIVTITDHSLTPTTNIADATAGGANNSRIAISRADFLNVMVEGTEPNKNFKEEYAYKIKFLKMLKENNVPVIFRPLHEANGGWFWWGVNSTTGVTGEDVAKLYVYIHDYLTKENGLDNILWQFNTGLAGGVPYVWYPGNDYVDLISTDWYADVNEVNSGNSYHYVDYYNQGQKLGKYAYALSEFGGDGSYDITAHSLAESLGLVEAQMAKGAKCAYVGFYFDFGDKQDCTLTEKALTLDEMKTYWDKVLK